MAGGPDFPRQHPTAQVSLTAALRVVFPALPAGARGAGSFPRIGTSPTPEGCHTSHLRTRRCEVTGATPDFFGMCKVVGKTKSPIETASADLREAFAMSQQQRNTSMKHILFAAALTAGVLATGPVFAQSAPPVAPADATATTPIDTDTFLRMVLSSNDWEIQSSELAKAKTSNASVVQFADMIIQDHTAAAAKLKETLEKKEEAPEGLPPAALTPKHQSMLQQLGAVTDGADFDKLYTDMQVQAHQEAIALFRSYASSGQDQALAGFAKETLPTLEKHLAEVEKLTGAN